MNQKKLTGRAIDAMTAAEKKKLVEQYERQTPAQRWAASRAPTEAEAGRAQRVARRMGRGRPKLGKGTRVVSVTVETDLLKRADAFARDKGLKRSELVSFALNQVLPSGN